MIGILFTGGTISMKIDPATGAALPALGAGEILAQAPQLSDVTAFEVEDVSRLPGPHVTPGHMWRLARRAAAWLARPDIDGLVITHGTDTMEETAYFLDLVLTSDKPVVLVGAMRTISDPGWDGPSNLVAAARVAAAPAARGHGALVVMGDRILAAREVRKLHTESASAFASPELGPLGVVDAGEAIFRRSPLPRPDWRDAAADEGLRVSRIDSRVVLLAAYTGITDAFVARAIEGDTRGVAIAAFGRGNVPPTMVQPLTSATRAGVLVMISSRSPAGRVMPRYGYAGGGLDLERAGAILAGDLPAAKARILMMVALGLGRDVAETRAIVQQQTR